MKLSIITIAYNNAKGLERTLQSVASQTWQEYEEIVVDGGSSDNSLEIIKEYKSKISHFIWISEPDKGVYDAMNKGIRMASGEYCLFLNSGDILANDNVLETLFRHELTADIISGNAIFEASKFHPKEQYKISPNKIKASDLIINFLPHQATLIRRALFDEIHPYDTSFKIVSDWLFFIEAILKYNATYQHVQLFVARCEMEGISSNPANNELMREEFHRGLKQVLPLYYEDYCQLKCFRYNEQSKESILVKQLNKKKVIQKLLRFQHLLYKIGWYAFHKRWSDKYFYAQLKNEDSRKKKQILLNLPSIPSLYERLENQTIRTGLIVSLTSYGKRVKDSLPYALYSLLTQSVVPDEIVVYLDREHWSNQNLPLILREMQNKDVKFRYVEDIKSYKKLIPALQDFPDSPILTVDDDFYYNSSIIEWLNEEYIKSDKKTIIGSWGCVPEKRNGHYLPYSMWKDCKYGNKFSDYSLFAGNGTIYPPHVFDDEILKSDVFMQLAPTADDIWFWVMEKRQDISIRLIPQAGYGLHTPINRIETYDLNQKGTLFFTNCTQGENDKQFNKLIEKYLNN